jgi:hypothetical protein
LIGIRPQRYGVGEFVEVGVTVGVGDGVLLCVIVMEGEMVGDGVAEKVAFGLSVGDKVPVEGGKVGEG